MSNFVNSIYKNQAVIYKVFLYLLTTAIIVYLFPKGSKFKYEYSKGQPWQYENLYAPFDFAILKSDEEIAEEKEEIRNNHTPYFTYNQEIPKQVAGALDAEIESVFSDSIMKVRGVRLIRFTERTLDDIYDRGLIQEIKPFKENIRLSEEVISYVASESKTNIRELIGILNRVIAFSRVHNKELTINDCKNILRDVFSQIRVITVDKIQNVVSNYFNIALSEMLSQRRSRPLARPRQIAMYLAKSITSRSLPEIGASSLFSQASGIINRKPVVYLSPPG